MIIIKNERFRYWYMSMQWLFSSVPNTRVYVYVLFSGLEGGRGGLIKEVSDIRPDIVVNGWHSGLWSKVLFWILFLSQILPRHLPAFARYRCQLTGLRYEYFLEKREWSWMLVKGNKDLSNLINGGFWLYWGSRQKSNPKFEKLKLGDTSLAHSFIWGPIRYP